MLSEEPRSLSQGFPLSYPNKLRFYLLHLEVSLPVPSLKRTVNELKHTYPHSPPQHTPQNTVNHLVIEHVNQNLERVPLFLSKFKSF